MVAAVSCNSWKKRGINVLTTNTPPVTTKKQHIINTALALFAQYGYQQIGMDRIAESAAVSKMTVYRHFATKDELFDAVLQERTTRFEQTITQTISQHKEPADQLKSIFVYYHHWFSQPQFNGCLFINTAVLFPNALNHSKALALERKAITRNLLTPILQQLLLSDDTVARLTAHIIKLIDGTIVSAQLKEEKHPAFNAWQATVSLLKAEGVWLETGKVFV